MSEQAQKPKSPKGLSFWASALIPIVALGLLLSIFAFGDPLSIFTLSLPPIEEITFERVRLSNDGFDVTLVNVGPDPVTVAQVSVDEAYWEFNLQPSNVIPRIGRAELHVPYPWVEGELHAITVLTSTGATFETELPIAIETHCPGGD